MNQKEIMEIRRRITPERTNITKIYGCYVNGEKQVISTSELSLAVMEKNDVEKYMDLFKKSLSGRIGRNLSDIEFTSQQVIEGEEHKLLMDLRECRLEDAALREKLCRKIIDVLTLDDQSNYLILLAYDVYDVPYKGKDNINQADHSEEVFRYIICGICPVKSRKAELGYDTGENTFRLGEAIPVVGSPELGFMFPAFDDRRANIYNALFYSKNTSFIRKEVVESLFHTSTPMAPGEQKNAFSDAFTQSLEKECCFDVVQSVHRQICERIEMHKQMKDPDPLELSAGDVAGILRDSGVGEERIEKFRTKCEEQFGEVAALNPDNIIESKKFEIVTPSVKITVSPEFSHMIHTKTVDGKLCLVVPVDGGITVNGVGIYVQKEE